MDRRFDDFRKRRQRGRWRQLVYPVLAAAALVAAILYFKETAGNIKRTASFDSAACVRILDMTRVFKMISPSPKKETLWFGSAEGLQVYNAATDRWRRYGLDHGLLSEAVFDICFFNGVPWVGTEKGAARWNDSLGRFVPITLPGKAAVLSVTSVEAVAGAGVFLAAEEGGLFYFQNGEPAGTPVKCPLLGDSVKINSLEYFGAALYVGGRNGELLEYHPFSAQWRRLVFSPPLPRGTQINDVLIHRREIWAALSDAGVWKGDSLSDTLRHVEDFPAKGAFVFEDEPDGFWCGTPFGLWRYNDAGQVWIQFVHPGEKRPADFQVVSLLSAPGRLYFGSVDLGAGFVTQGKVQWQTIHGALGRSNVCALAASDSFVWAGYGYQGGTLDQFDARSMQFQKGFGGVDGVLEPNIQTFTVCDSTVYYGGFKGFGYFKAGSSRSHHFGPREGDFLLDIAQVAAGDAPPYYLAGLFGVVKYYPQNDSFSHLTLTRNDRVTSILPRGDSLWLGTLSHGIRVVNRVSGSEISKLEKIGSRVVGLAEIAIAGSSPDIFIAAQKEGCFHIDPKRGQMIPLPVPTECLPRGARGFDGEIFCMAKIGQTIFLGTRQAGCLLFDAPSGRWSRLTALDGLAGDQVRSFCASGPYIWVGSYGGVARFDRQYLSKKWGITL